MDGISLDIPRLKLHKWGHNPIYKYPIITPQLMLMLAAPGPRLLPPLARAKHCVCGLIFDPRGHASVPWTLLKVHRCQPKQSQLADLRKNLGFYQLKDDVILIWSQSLNGIGVQRRLSWAVLCASWTPNSVLYCARKSLKSDGGSTFTFLV